MAREELPADARALARELCDRHRGIGADGVVFLVASPGGPAMEIYNSDGSVAAMCGNGIRCLAALARREGLLEGDRALVATRSGDREVRLLGGPDPWMVEVDMGPPLQMEGPEAVLVGGEPRPCTTISMGNPHRVVFVEGLEAVDLLVQGPLLERDHAYPGGLNVEFVQVLSRGRLAVKVWERGAGATLACGTGACAALVAAGLAGLCDRSAQVDLPGGALRIEWGHDGRVRMTGPARELFRGTWKPDGGAPPPPPPPPPPVKLSD